MTVPEDKSTLSNFILAIQRNYDFHTIYSVPTIYNFSEDAVTIWMMRSALLIIFGFFLSFLINTTIFIIPQYMDIRSMTNIYAQISQMIPNSFMKVYNISDILYNSIIH